MEEKPAPEVKSKIWIELKDEVVFGLGRIRLFEAIERTGSISKAAAELGDVLPGGMGKSNSHRRASAAPTCGEGTGKSENGTRLTPVGKELLARYKIFQQDAIESVDRLFDEHLGNLLSHLKKRIRLHNNGTGT